MISLCFGLELIIVRWCGLVLREVLCDVTVSFPPLSFEKLKG